MLKTSEKGLKQLMAFEGVRTTPYICSAGYPTEGVGHKMLDTNGNPLRAGDTAAIKIYRQVFTKDDALRLLAKDIKEYEEAVYSTISANLEQHQFDMLVSLCFNIGCGAFKKSTVTRKINEEASIRVISESWIQWNKAGGKVIQGLTNRRMKEIEIFKNGYK